MQRFADSVHWPTGLPNNTSKQKGKLCFPAFVSNYPGAGDESRTRDLNLGKVALYQLSYSRMILTASQRIACLCLFATALHLPQHAASKIWSGRRVSNSRPQPWQGCALPTELLPRIAVTTCCYCSLPLQALLRLRSGALTSEPRAPERRDYV